MTTEEHPHHESVPQEEEVVEEHSFDTLARSLADETLSRRKALKLVGAAILGFGSFGLLGGVAGAAPPLGKGKCKTPPFTTKCSKGKCVDTSTDPSNCGSCGNQCPPEASGCSGGNCCTPAGVCVGHSVPADCPGLCTTGFDSRCCSGTCSITTGRCT